MYESRLPFDLSWVRSQSGSTEARAQIADHVDLLPGRILARVDSIVFILQIPIVDERHHHPQAVQFLRPTKGVVCPLPLPDLLLAFVMSLEPNVVNGAVGFHQFLAAMQLRHFSNLQVWDKVILIGEVADCPNQAGSHGFRASFGAHLDLPFEIAGIFHVELGIAAIKILVHEGEGTVRFMLLAAGTVEQVASGDVGRLPPKHRARASNFSLGGIDFVPFFPALSEGKANGGRR